MAQLLNKDPYTYHKERDSFVKDLKRFHACRGTPVNRMPTVGGKAVDLFLLYTKVTELGGWEKVNDNQQWEDLLPVFNLPVACTNAGHALKLLYLRYLEVYERVNFKGELTIRPQYEDDMDDQASGRKKRARPTDAIPSTYKYQQHNLTVSQRDHLHLPALVKDPLIFAKLEQSLLSGLPNEVDFVLNVVTLLSSEGRHTLQLHQCPRLLELLMAHVAIYRYEGTLVKLHQQWKSNSGKNFLRFWYDTVKDKEIRNLISSEGIILQNGVFVEGKNMKLPSSPNDDHQYLFNLSQDLGIHGAEGQRVLQLATIVRNLSFEQKNMEELASSILVFRFIMLCAHNTWGNLKQMALDTLGNIAPKMVLDPITNLTTQLILRTISRYITSQDKFEIVSGLDILSGLCQVEPNEDLLCDQLETPSVYESLVALLTIHDIQLIVHALETLYQLSELGEATTSHIAGVHTAVETLVSLVTVEAQSYGPGSLMGIKVVELMSASSSFTPASQAQQQQQQQQPLSVVAHTPIMNQPIPAPLRQVTLPSVSQAVASPAQPAPPQPVAQRVSVASTPATTTTTATANVYRPPTPQTPTPVVPATTQELDADALFLFWLHTTYEHRIGASQQIPRVALFQEYSIICNKTALRNVVHVDKIPNLVRAVFPMVDQRFIQLEGGKSDVVYTGLRKKPAVAPFPPASPADAMKFLSQHGVTLTTQKPQAPPVALLKPACTENKPLMTPPASPASYGEISQQPASAQFPSIQQALLGNSLPKPANHVMNITTGVKDNKVLVAKAAPPTSGVLAPPSSNVTYSGSTPVSVQYVMAASSQTMVPATTQSTVIVHQWPQQQQQQQQQQQAQYQYSVVQNPQTFPATTIVHQPQVIIPPATQPIQAEQNTTKSSSKKKSSAASPKSPKPKSPAQAKSPKAKKTPSSPKAPKSPKSESKTKSPKSKKSKVGANKYVDMLDDGLGGEEESGANLSGQSDLLQQAMMESDLFADDDDAAMDTELYSAETMLSGQVMDQVNINSDIPLEEVSNGDEAAAAALALSQDPLVADNESNMQPPIPPLELPSDITGADALFNGLSLPSTPCSVASSIDSKESESSQPKDILKAAVTKALGRRIHIKEDGDLIQSSPSMDIKSQLSTFNGAVKHLGNGDCHAEDENSTANAKEGRSNGGVEFEDVEKVESSLKTLCQTAGDSLEVDSLQRDVEMAAQQTVDIPMENGYSDESPASDLKESESALHRSGASGPLQVDGCADDPDSDGESTLEPAADNNRPVVNIQSESLALPEPVASHENENSAAVSLGSTCGVVSEVETSSDGLVLASQGEVCHAEQQLELNSVNIASNPLVTHVNITVPQVDNTTLTLAHGPSQSSDSSGGERAGFVNEGGESSMGLDSNTQQSVPTMSSASTSEATSSGQSGLLVSRFSPSVTCAGGVMQQAVASSLVTTSTVTLSAPQQQVPAVHVLLHRPPGQHTLAASHTLPQPIPASYHEPHPIPSLGNGLMVASCKPSMIVSQNAASATHQISLQSPTPCPQPPASTPSHVQFMQVTQPLAQQNSLQPKFIQVPHQQVVQMTQQVLSQSTPQTVTSTLPQQVTMHSIPQPILQQTVVPQQQSQQFVQGHPTGIVQAQQLVTNPQVTQAMAQQIGQLAQASPGQQQVGQAQMVMQPQQELAQAPYQVDMQQHLVQQQVPLQMVRAQQVPTVQVAQQQIQALPQQLAPQAMPGRMPVPTQTVSQTMPQTVQFQKVQLSSGQPQVLANPNSQPQQILPKPVVSGGAPPQVVHPVTTMMAPNQTPQQQVRVRFVTVTPQGQQQVMHISMPPGMSLQTFLQQQQQKLQQQGIQPAVVTCGQQVIIAATSAVNTQVPLMTGVTATSSSHAVRQAPPPQPAPASQPVTQPLTCSTDTTPQSSPLPSPSAQKPSSKQQAKRNRSASPGAAVKPPKNSKKKKGDEVAAQVTSPTISPDVVLQYTCEWKGCKRNFDSVTTISKHVTGEHFPQGTGPFLCDWEGCDKLPRQRWSFMTHLQDRHLNVQVLQKTAIQRHHGNTAPIQQPPAPPPVYPKDAAIQAIRRFSLRPPYQELMEGKEGPVTKHIRLTSALILRNLARYSALGRSKIKRYEQHLAFVALSSVESSSAIANCLLELHKH